MKIVLDNIRSAWNVGNILRTCDAAGVEEIIFCGITPDGNNPKVIKTALGAEKNLSFKSFNTKTKEKFDIDYQDTIDALNYLKEEGYKIIAVEQDERSKMLFKDDFSSYKDKISLVFGNENNGISKEILDLCDDIIELPMLGKKESLNVCVTAGIIIYHFGCF